MMRLDCPSCDANGTLEPTGKPTGRYQYYYCTCCSGAVLIHLDTGEPASTKMSSVCDSLSLGTDADTHSRIGGAGS